MSFLVVCASLTGCGQRQAIISGPTMGTTYQVKFLFPPGVDRKQQDALSAKLSDEIKLVLADVNAKMSTYQKDSELSLFNAYRGDEPFPVDRSLIKVLQLSREISDLSGGAFDISIGPIVNAYGFGPDPRSVNLPTREEIEALRERVGYEKLEIDLEKNTVAKKHPEMYIDLSAVAKGYGVDRVAEVMTQAGVVNFMVEIGGELRVGGHNASGKPWQIAVEKPTEGPERTVQRVLALSDVAMATSGDYRNYYLQDGQRISHTIDARSGRPVEHGLASATVLAADCARADALATAFMVLGPEEGLALAQERGIAVLFLLRGDKEQIIEKLSPEFEKWLQK